MDPVRLVQDNLPVFLLVLARASAMFATMPIFGGQNVPALARAGTILVMTVVVLPILPPQPDLDLDWGFLAALLKEIGVGLVMGFAASFIFDGVTLAGELVGMQMGFGAAQMFNPQSERQIPLIAQFFFIVALFTFFALDGHHWLVVAFVKSFQVVPFGQLTVTGQLIQQILHLVSGVFLVAFILMVPVVGVLLLVDLVMAIVSKTIPQLQVIFLSFPIKIYVGLVTLALLLPFFVAYLRKVFAQSLGQMMRLF